MHIMFIKIVGISFILTMWYVNERIKKAKNGETTSFILTMWYVNIFEFLKAWYLNNCFILTMWYVNIK